MFRALQQNWFLVALILTLGLGWQFYDALNGLPDAKWLTQSVIFVVMYLMSLSLETKAVIKTIRNPLPAFLASVINLGIVPPLTFVFAMVLERDMAVGLIVLGSVPCTLASAAVWTRRAGGNDAVALMTTVITNATCFVFTPMWIFLLSGAASADYSFADLVLKLLLIVLLPMTLGQLSRLRKPVGRLATDNKVLIGVLCQCGILVTVLTGAVATGLRMQSAGQSAPLSAAATLMVISILIHLGTLNLGINLGRLLGLPRGDRIAVGFSGSQKTLMIGLAICLQLDVSILPMVVYHAVQLLVDTPIADWLRKRGAQPA